MNAVHEQIEGCIPSLRSYARALTRNPVSADDLVQECVSRALLKQHLFVRGTNLRAWLTTIMHNLYVNDRRRSRYTELPLDFEDSVAMAVPPQQENRMMVRAAERALWLMPDLQRLALELVKVEGHSYDDVSILLGVPVGTVKSRVSRARKFVMAILDGELGDTIVASRAPRNPVRATGGSRRLH